MNLIGSSEDPEIERNQISAGLKNKQKVSQRLPKGFTKTLETVIQVSERICKVGVKRLFRHFSGSVLFRYSFLFLSVVY